MPADLIEKLKNVQYDFVLVPIANNHLQGFQNVLEVAQQIDLENVFYVYPEGRLQPVSDLPVAI
jgi:hypothetical protein